jgi:hypothetical protein
MCPVHKYFSYPSLIIYFVFNPTHETKTVIASTVGGRLLIATHLGQSNCFPNQQQVLGFAMPFPTSANCTKMLGQNHFVEPNWHALTFFHPIFICRLGHILSTAFCISGCDEYVTLKTYFWHPSWVKKLGANFEHFWLVVWPTELLINARTSASRVCKLASQIQWYPFFQPWGPIVGHKSSAFISNLDITNSPSQQTFSLFSF